VIISPDLVICIIVISAKVVQLSLMFLYVANTPSPSFISQSSVSAGAAAAAAWEALKDKQHEANVVAAGQFYPLIVETFGVWTPFARETLKDIARRTIQQEMDCPLRKLLEI